MATIALRNDVLELHVLADLGARWHRLRAFGHDLLRTPPDPSVHGRDPLFWGAYVMGPWCNRAPAGPMDWRGRRIDLASNFPDGTAIHGQVHTAAWEISEVGEAPVMRIEAGRDGWPWRYAVTQRLGLEAATLRVELTLRNLDDAPMPGGVGLHPWFVRPVEVAVAGALAYERNADSPRQPAPVAGSFDLRRLGFPAPGLDATWTDLADPAVRLRWPPLGVSAAWHLSAAAPHVVVASPQDPHATAVEPQTHAPDGLRRLMSGDPGALAVLGPGEELRLGVELRFEAA